MSKKRRISVLISEDVIKEFNLEVVNKKGKVYGEISKSIEEAMLSWIEKSQKERGV